MNMQTSAHSPDHPLKQVMDDEVRLSHHDQQSHVGPTKLEEGRKTQVAIFIHTFKK